MPLQKLSKGNFLDAETIEQHGAKWKITSEPELKDVEFNGKKSQKYEVKVVSVKDKEERTYSMNPTSSDYLIDKLGTEGKRWVNETIEIEVIAQVIAGEKKKVLYVKGAFEE